MKKILIIISIFCSLKIQAQTVPSNTSTAFTYQQVKNLAKKTRDSVANEFRIEDSKLITRLNNQNVDRIVLEARVRKLEDFISTNTIDYSLFKNQIDSISMINLKIDSLIISIPPDQSNAIKDLQVLFEMMIVEIDRLRKLIPIITFPE